MRICGGSENIRLIIGSMSQTCIDCDILEGGERADAVALASAHGSVPEACCQGILGVGAFP